MSSPTLIDSLRALSLGQPGAFEIVAETMHAAILRNDADFLNKTLSLAVTQESPGILHAFDGMMNMFCTEPLRQAAGGERQWRSYAVTAILRHPVGLVLTRLGDTAPLEKMLAAELQMDVSRVKCDPMVLPTWSVYNDGPLDAYQQCEATKVWAEGQLKTDARELAINFWEGSEKVQRTDEAVFLVSVHCTEDEGQKVLDRLQSATMNQTVLLMLEAPVANGPAVTVKVLLVDAGGAWTLFNQALHTSDMYRVGGALRAVSQKHSIQMADVLLIAAYVEEDDDDHHTLRVSMLNKHTGELLAGMLFCDLHEPEQFMILVDQLLEQMNASPFQRLEPTFYDAELAESGDTIPRFFVPNSGWQLPPELV